MRTTVQVPMALASDSILEQPAGEIMFRFAWDHPAAVVMLSDPYVLQRFLTLVQVSASVVFVWTDQALAALYDSPGQVALLAAAIHIDKSDNQLEDGAQMSVSRRVALQQSVSQHRLLPSWFDAADSLICSDNEKRGWQIELYSEPGKLRPRSDFTRLVTPLLRAKVTGLAGEEGLLQWKDALISVLYELFENTHIHARFEYDRTTLCRNLIRALIVRIVRVSTGANENQVRSAERRSLDCLELSIVDSGIGFFGSRFARPLLVDDSLREEWLNLRLCLDKHVDDVPADNSHRGIGLYEVLRALHFLRGAIQVRSGRTFGYRSFFPTDVRQQMESRASLERPGMPRGKLLDFRDPYRPTPTLNPLVSGVAIRTLIPLTWDV